MKSAIVLVTLFNISMALGAGGISGGGGNVINPSAPKTYQDPREIRNIIRGSKDLLTKFISAKYALYRTGSMDYEAQKIYSVLFSENDLNLHEIMEEIKLDIALDRPCFDQNGTAFDGSTFNPKEHSVCISAFTIAQKVDRYEVPVQSAALVMHEFSEVAGLSDEDAILLQKEVILELKSW